MIIKSLVGAVVVAAIGILLFGGFIQWFFIGVAVLGVTVGQSIIRRIFRDAETNDPSVVGGV